MSDLTVRDDREDLSGDYSSSLDEEKKALRLRQIDQEMQRIDAELNPGQQSRQPAVRSKPPGALESIVSGTPLDPRTGIPAFALGVREIPAQLLGGVLDVPHDLAQTGQALGEAVGSLIETNPELAKNLGVGNDGPGQQGLRNLLSITGAISRFVPEPDSTIGGFTREAAAFMSVFIPMLGPAATATRSIGLGGRTAAVATAALSGAVADATTVDRTEGNLSAFIQEFPALENPVNEFLAVGPEDTQAEAKLKATLEGLALGVAADTIILGLRSLRAGRIARKAAEEGAEVAAPEAVEEVSERLSKEIGTPEERVLISDPETPDFRLVDEPRPDPADRVVQAEADLTSEFGEAVEPLGVRRSPVVDVSLRELPESEFEVQRVASVREVDRLERVFDETPGRADTDLAFRRELAQAQDQFDATSNEAFRREAMEWDPEEIAFQFQQLDTRTPGQKTRLLLLMEVVHERDIASDIEPLLRRFAQRSPDHAEILQVQMRDLAQLREELTQPAVIGDGNVTREMISERAESNRIAGQRVETNWDRIEGSDDVKRLIDDATQAFSSQVSEARRGARSNEITEEAADLLGLTPSDLLRRKKGEAFNADQVTAFRKVHASAGNELERLATAAGSPDARASDILKFRKMVAVFHALNQEFMGLRAEAGRALQSFRIPVGGNAERTIQIATMIDNLGGREVSQKFARHIVQAGRQGWSPGQINQAVRKGWLATTEDALREAFTLGLLWRPSTHIVNSMSHFLVAGNEIAVRGSAGLLNQAVGNVGARHVSVGESVALADGFTNGIRDAFRVAAARMREGDSLLEKVQGAREGLREAAEQRGIPITSKLDAPEPKITAERFRLNEESGFGRFVDFFGRMTRIPGAALGLSDDFGKTVLYSMEIQAQAHRQALLEGGTQREIAERAAELVQNPPESLRVAALDFALEGTFTKTLSRRGENGVNVPVARNLIGTINRVPIIGYMVAPYVRTPTNIFRYGYSNSPLAPFVGQWRAAVEAGGPGREIALTRIAVGSAIALAVLDFAEAGMISGSGPQDPARKEALMRQGWQPDSIRVGDEWIAYNRLDAVGMQAALAAGLAEVIREKEIDQEDLSGLSEIVSAMVVAHGMFAMNKTYMRGFSNVLSIMQDPKNRAGFVARQQVANSIPFSSVLRQGRDLADPALRETESIPASIQNMIAGWSENLPNKRTLFGHPIPKEVIFNPFVDLFAPTRKRTVRESPVDREIEENGADIRRIKKKGGSQGINFREFPKVYEEYSRQAGHAFKANGLGAEEFLNAVITGNIPPEATNPGTIKRLHRKYHTWQTGPDGPRSQFLRNTVTDYRQSALQAILGNQDDQFSGAEFDRFRDEFQFQRVRKIDLRRPVEPLTTENILGATIQ